MVNYYDDYDHLLNQGNGYDVKLKYVDKSGYGARYIHPSLGAKTPKGLLVGARVKQLQSNGTISGEIATAMYYDNRGRLIQTKSTNHLGGTEEEYIAYNFIGQPTLKLHLHTATGAPAQTEFYAYTYDHAGRLIDTKHKLNTGAETLLAKNEYDDLGRLKKSTKNNNASLATSYAYNIRSWTASISSPLFTQKLYYNTVPQGASVKAQYGGNISAMSWTVKDDLERKYGFSYDGLSRLTHAAYGYITSGGSFSTSYTYDKHGNMMNHVQRGLKSKGAYDTVDNLAMSYNGNQLVNVHNQGTGSNESTSAHFEDYSKDKDKKKIEYTYNNNGALTKDLNKGISSIVYNSLNLPASLTIDDPNNTKARGDIQYTYSASGQKLRTIHKEDIGLARMPIVGVGVYATPSWQTTVTDYVGNKIYEQVDSRPKELKRILVDGGYYDVEKKKYFYYLTDHLGNNRVVAEANGTVVQHTHYYPFGMAFAEEKGQKEQPYKYNGKELDRRLQLNTYDYAARYMDPAYGRFTSIDPLAEKYYNWSPYVYVGNNPIKRIDPNGKDWVDKVMGTAVALVDNLTWGALDLRTVTTGVVTDAVDYNYGQDVGDVASIVIGAIETVDGTGKVVGGVTVTVGTGGALTVVAAPTAITGAVETIHGVGVVMNASSNLTSGKGRITDKTPQKPNDGNNKPTRNERAQQKKENKQSNKQTSSESKYNQESEHTNNKRNSTKQDHQNGQSRKQKDKGGEKADEGRKRYK